MRVVYEARELEVPPQVKVRVERIGDFDYRVEAEGPLGKAYKELRNTPVNIEVRDGRLVFWVYNARKREYAQLRTVESTVRNLITGVLRGWRYRLKVIYTHFPMLVKVEGGRLVIENFLGRKSKIHVEIPPGVKVQVAGKEDIVVEGIDRELVSQTAARIREATTLRGDEKPSPHGREGGIGVVDGIYPYAVEHIA